MNKNSFFHNNLTTVTKSIPKSFFDIKINDIDGKSTELSSYKGTNTHFLIVNVASACGLTDSNYLELVKLYNKHLNKLQILAFPCNQFASQESKCELDIKKFVETKYSVKFPIFSKIDVNGDNSHDAYLYLKENTKELKEGSQQRDIPWNFAIFLLNNQGEVLRYYEPNKDISGVVKDVNDLI